MLLTHQDREYKKRLSGRVRSCERSNKADMIRLWETEIRATKPSTGELTLYGGPTVPGITHADAQAYCENNGLGYCKVIGELVAKIPCKPGTHEPDWANMIDYETGQNN